MKPITKFNQSEFIRARPNMTPQEVVADADKLGQVVKINNVYNLRNRLRKEASAPGSSPKVSKASKKNSTPVAADTEIESTTFNKSEFIRLRPNKSASDISAEAETLGQDIPPQMVWSIRSSDKKKAAEAAPAKPVAKKAVKKAVKKVMAKPVAKKAAKKVMAKPVAKKAVKKAVKKVMAKPVAKKVPRVTATQVSNGNKVTVVVFDPRDIKGVKAANRAIREAIAHA